MAFLVLRSNIASLVLTILYNYPLMQTLFLIILDGAILLFMLIRKPFTTLRGIVFQYSFELIALAVHFGTFILSWNEDPSEGLKDFICTVIIYLNAALVMSGLCFMAIEIHETVCEKIKEWKLRNSEKKTISLNEESEQIIQNHSASFVETRSSLTKHQNINRESPEIHFPSNNDTRIRPLQPPFQTLNSSQNGESSILTDDIQLVNHNQPRTQQRIHPIRLEQ